VEQKRYTIKQRRSRRAEEITVTIQLNVGLHISTKNGVMQLKLRKFTNQYVTKKNQNLDRRI